MKTKTSKPRIFSLKYAVILLLFLAGVYNINAQNVCISGDGSTPIASSMLEVKSTTSGFLTPRMTSAQKTAIGTPATGLLIYQTDGTSGFYYYTGSVWKLIGGSGWDLTGNVGTTAGTNFLGTTDAVDFIIKTNSSERMRIKSDGKVGIGITPTSLFHVSGSASISDGDLVRIVNSCSGGGDAMRSYNKGGVQYACLFADNSPNSDGSDYGITKSNAALQGQISITKNYSFAAFGQVGGGGVRIAGVMGCGQYTSQWAGLGYYSSGYNSYSIYYCNYSYGSGSGSYGKIINNDSNAISSGLGIGGYADLLGAGIRGGMYGIYAQGARFGLYTDGKTYTNDVIAQLSDVSNPNKLKNDERIVTYVPTSTSVDVYTKGTAQMLNGTAYIEFDENFKKLISEQTIIVTVTPKGNSNGVYIERVGLDGFTIKENNNGTSNVEIAWIATGTRKGYENPENPKELLSKNFDANMRKVINNESDLSAVSLGIYWDGSKLNFGTVPANSRPLQIIKSTKEEDKKGILEK